ncbi:MAG: hypothetical protein QM813_26335 [Verrucomicrobiota bacterium]
MKKLFIVAFAVAAFIAAFTPQAKAGYDSDVLTLSTNACPGGTNQWLYTKIPVGAQKDVAVQIEFNMSGAGTADQTFVFAPSVTGSTNDVDTLTSRWKAVGIPATGASRVSLTTNLSSFGAGTLFLMYSTNAHGSGGVYQTNLIVRKGEKTMAP